MFEAASSALEWLLQPAPSLLSAQIRDSTLQTARHVQELKKGRWTLDCPSLMRSPDAAFGQTTLALVHGCSRSLRELSLGMHVPGDAGHPPLPAVLGGDDGPALHSDVAALVNLALSGKVHNAHLSVRPQCAGTES